MREPALLARAKRWARTLRAESVALYLAARDPRTPWYAKALAGAVAAYALSPIDLIPDFVPVLGYLDDLLVLPAGIALAVRLVPKTVMEDARAEAQAWIEENPSRFGIAAYVIVSVWIAVLLVLGVFTWKRVG
ncbi:MAG: YkvA family protein [Rhodothermales bacterium]